MTSEQTQLLLRLPTQLKADLQRHATAQGRKLTQEVVIRLKASLDKTTEQGIAPSSTNYPVHPLATVLHTNEPGHANTSLDQAMLKVFRALPVEKQLALLTLLK